MRSTSARWAGRFGILWIVSILLLIAAAIFLAISLINLQTAQGNPAVAQTVTVEQLVADEIPADRHVSVTANAVYDFGYRETDGTNVIADYYFLMDDSTATMILVKSPSLPEGVRKSATVTIVGMTRLTNTNIRTQLQGDIPQYEELGWKTTPKLYIAEDQVAPVLSGNILGAAISGAVLIVALVGLVILSIKPSPKHASPIG